MTKVLIESSNRISGYPENYTVKLSQPVKNVKRVTLLSAQIPRATYPILAGYNDVLHFSFGGTPFNATIPERNYDGFQLISTLNSIMNTAASTTAFVSTYNSDTNKFTFIVSTSTLSLLAASVQPRVKSLIGMRDTDNFSAVVSAACSNQVNLSFPSDMILTLNMGHNFNGNVITSVNRYTFIILSDNVHFGEKLIFEELSDYTLVDENSNASVQYIDVKFSIETLDGVIINGKDKLFWGLNHQILLELA